MVFLNTMKRALTLFQKIPELLAWRPFSAQHGRAAGVFGWYASAAFHALAWLLITAGTMEISTVAIPPEPRPALAATLGDQEVIDDAAKMELIAPVFSGLPEDAPGRRLISSELQAVEAGWAELSRSDAVSAVLTPEDSGDSGGEKGEFLFRVPESGLAVTKGSFTAWAEPAEPKPGESYLIIIEVRLPDDVKRYRLADLSGEVLGSDRYRQRIPWDRRAPGASAASVGAKLTRISSSDVLQVKDHKIQLVIKVPGAARLVRDRIQIRSGRLRESQELTLVFGGPSAVPTAAKK
jgi:hypothetical protein